MRKASVILKRSDKDRLGISASVSSTAQIWNECLLKEYPAVAFTRKRKQSSADISSRCSCPQAPETQPPTRRTSLRASHLSAHQYTRGSAALRPSRAG